MRTFATRWFVRFARKERISGTRLVEAIRRAEQGTVDATLGGHLIKQRVARPGAGKSGGYRTIIAFHAGTRSVFLYGFAKNERENIDPTELEDLKALGRLFLRMTEDEVGRALDEQELTELFDEQSKA